MNVFVWIYKLNCSDLILLEGDDLCSLFFPHFPGGSEWKRVLLLFVDGYVLMGIFDVHNLIGEFENPPGHKFWKGPWVVGTDLDMTILYSEALT